MRLTRRQLRSIIKETLLLEQTGEGVGGDAIQSFIVNDLLAKEKEMKLEDILEQSEGAGFDSKEAEEVVAELLDTGVLVDEGGVIAVV